MNTRRWGVLLPALLALNACDTDNVAGTNNETHSKGTLFQSNGQIAVGARVRIFSASQGAGDSLPVAETKVNSAGRISLKLEPGRYSLLADDSTGRAVFIDSILSSGDTLSFDSDTLRPTGTLSGHLRVQPMHSPAIAWVHVMRTNLFANVDSSGAFRIESVPAGKMEVVALSHLPEYTPTFRKAQAISDSTVDVGTLDLVYNGLPLATDLAATYDSLTGVVTLTWRDTAFARKEGWLVYRGLGAPPLPTQMSKTKSASYSDSLFRGKIDSSELDLTYWVAAEAKDGSEGARWNKATLHAKSPSLVKRWSVDWVDKKTSPATQTGNSVFLDTLKTGLAILEADYTASTDSCQFNSPSKYRLSLLQSDGTWKSTFFQASMQTPLPPLFHQGRLWIARGKGRSGTIPGDPNGTSCREIPTWDSVTILSTTDAETWDSTSLPLADTSISGFRLRISSGGGLLLDASRMDYTSVVSQYRFGARGLYESTDGVSWSARPFDAFLQANPNYWTRGEDEFRPLLGSSGNWTYYAPVYWSMGLRSYLIPGESTDTGAAPISQKTIGNRFKARNLGNLIALSFPDGFALTSTPTPSFPQWVRIPEVTQFDASHFCFWRGQLVVLGKSGLHFATIAPNP